MAKGFSESPIKDEAVYQKKLRITQNYFSERMEVLEFGCGTGGTAIAHAPYVKHILATDFSHRMLEFARESAELKGAKNISFELTSIEDLDNRASSFDVVLGMGVLHLLKDKRKGLSRVYDLLKDGGVFISSPPCLANSSFQFKFRRVIAYFLGFGPLIRFFSTEKLEALMQQAGFVVELRWAPDLESLNAVFLVARKTTKYKLEKEHS